MQVWHLLLAGWNASDRLTVTWLWFLNTSNMMGSLSCHLDSSLWTRGMAS